MDFYTEVVIIAIGAAAALGALWKNSNDIIDKLEGIESEEGFLIAAHIWATNIKASVEEFFAYVQKSISESESTDRYAELFGEKDKIDVLQEKIDRLDKSYKAYIDFRNLVPSLVHETEEAKKWIVRTFCLSFGFAIWGAVGFLIESQGQPTLFLTYGYWAALLLLTFVSVWSLAGITKHMRKCGLIKSAIRREKSKYASVVGKVT